MMVQPGQDRDGDNDTGPLHRPTQRRILAQRALIGSEYQPIRGRGQPFWVCGRDNGAGSLP
jgi:hypothetical protein